MTCLEALNKDPVVLWRMHPTYDTCMHILGKYSITSEQAAIIAGILLGDTRASYEYLVGKSSRIIIMVYDSDLGVRDILLTKLAKPSEKLAKVAAKFALSMHYTELTRTSISRIISLLSLVANLGYIDKVYDDLIELFIECSTTLRDKEFSRELYSVLLEMCPTDTRELVKPDHMSAQYEAVWDTCFGDGEKHYCTEYYLDKVRILCEEVGACHHSYVLKLLREEEP